MLFYEKLSVKRLIILWVTKKNNVFYGSKSITTRLFEKFDLSVNAKIITFGDVQTATNIRHDAYKAAELHLNKVKGKYWAEELSEYLGINFPLIFRKFFFEELYTKYEFMELALRYADENPNESHIIYVEHQFLEPYKEKLKMCFKVRVVKEFKVIHFLTIFLIPGFLSYVWKRDGVACEKYFENKIVCKIDGEKLYEMFSNIFQDYYLKSFVIEKEYANELSDERLSELGVIVLGLTRDDYQYLRRAAYGYVYRCLKNYTEISMHGSKLFLIFKAIIDGRANSILGTGNLFFTYEHSILRKAVRNEFLRSNGNQSILVAMNAHATPRYYHSEIFCNYDVICAAGRHIEHLYKERRSVTNVFLPTGSYDSHRGSIKIQGREERIARLKAFKGDSTAVTILSPGICPPTYSHEIRLMKLARDISMQQGVKVFIRLKDVPLSSNYANFYAIHTAGYGSISVTFTEYELTDFLEVTDLFVTSISNSGCDMALSGGQVMFVDFMKEPDLHLFRSVVPDAILTEEESFRVIMSWVRDHKPGKVRSKHTEVMHKLVDYLGYKFIDFADYKMKFMEHQKSTFRNHPAWLG